MHLQQGSLLHVCGINCCLNKGKAQRIIFNHPVYPAGPKEQAHEHFQLALGHAIFRSVSSGQWKLLNPNCNQNSWSCKTFQKYLQEVKSQVRKGVSISAFLQAQNIHVRLLFSTGSPCRMCQGQQLESCVPTQLGMTLMERKGNLWICQCRGTAPVRGKERQQLRVTAPATALTDRMLLTHCTSCSRPLKRREKMLWNCF